MIEVSGVAAFRFRLVHFSRSSAASRTPYNWLAVDEL
jgi:hypothetical protein